MMFFCFNKLILSMIWPRRGRIFIALFTHSLTFDPIRGRIMGRQLIFLYIYESFRFKIEHFLPQILYTLPVRDVNLRCWNIALDPFFITKVHKGFSQRTQCIDYGVVPLCALFYAQYVIYLHLFLYIHNINFVAWRKNLFYAKHLYWCMEILTIHGNIILNRECVG